MSPERQRAVIAELCGITCRSIRDDEETFWVALDEKGEDLGGPLAYYYDKNSAILSESPDYLNDLNAMHQAKRKLLTNRYLCDFFNDLLIEEKLSRPVEFETDKWTWGQSAGVEARALIKTLSVWEES